MTGGGFGVLREKSDFDRLSRGENLTDFEQLPQNTACIKHNGKQIHLGYFESESDAAATYDSRAKVLFGEFARLNFPQAAGKQTKDEKVLCMQEVANCPGLS